MYSTAITLAATLFASAGLAAPTARAYEDGTFQLLARDYAASGTGGSPVAAFHSGAAIEALVMPPTGVVFETNSTEFNAKFISTTDRTAYINYRDDNGNDTPLQLYNNGTSNENFLFFGGSGNGPQIFVLNPQDNEGTKQVGVYVNATSSQFEFWICPQETLGYTYETVTWVQDSGIPADPQCREILLFSKPYPY